jgi:hypothetical protein
MLFTAYHGLAAPTGPPWRGTIAVLGEQMIWIYLEILAANPPRLSLAMWDLDPTWLTYEYTQLGSCHGPAGGAPAAGVGGGRVPTERIPRGKPPNLARWGEIADFASWSCARRTVS